MLPTCRGVTTWLLHVAPMLATQDKFVRSDIVPRCALGVICEKRMCCSTDSWRECSPFGCIFSASFQDCVMEFAKIADFLQSRVRLTLTALSLPGHRDKSLNAVCKLSDGEAASCAAFRPFPDQRPFRKGRIRYNPVSDGTWVSST